MGRCSALPVQPSLDSSPATRPDSRTEPAPLRSIPDSMRSVDCCKIAGVVCCSSTKQRAQGGERRDRESSQSPDGCEVSPPGANTPRSTVSSIWAGTRLRPVQPPLDSSSLILWIPTVTSGDTACCTSQQPCQPSGLRPEVCGLLRNRRVVSCSSTKQRERGATQRIETYWLQGISTSELISPRSTVSSKWAGTRPRPVQPSLDSSVFLLVDPAVTPEPHRPLRFPATPPALRSADC